MKFQPATLVMLIFTINIFPRCTYRWPVKTMSDTLQFSPAGKKLFNNASVIYPGNVIHTTIDSLVNLPRPAVDAFRTEQETRIYAVEGKIFYWTIEPDRDIHIAISSGKAKMICEIPNPSKAKNSIVLNEIKNARHEFMKYKRSWFRMKPGIYRITGVLFYDQEHNVIGSNKAHVELHPVVKFEKL